MKTDFFIDVTLKDLMNLGKRAAEVKQLDFIFNLLQNYWYNLEDKKEQEERENRIRVGSIWVYLDDDGALHLDFVTRFGFKDKDKVGQFLSLLKKMD